MRLSSSAFAHGNEIPSVHTCEGPDTSPPLDWDGIPEGTRSLALIVDDPDAPDPRAPRMIWVHWLLYNLPPDTPGLTAAVEPSDLPPGTCEGVTDFRRTGWGGPCPPVGRHRYFFRLYALDRMLPDLGRPSRADLDRAMADHVLGQTELMGTYQKRGKC